MLKCFDLFTLCFSHWLSLFKEVESFTAQSTTILSITLITIKGLIKLQPWLFVTFFFSFECPGAAVVTGMASEYNWDDYDRHWKIKCTNLAENYTLDVGDCSTVAHGNRRGHDWDVATWNLLDYPGLVLRGFESYLYVQIVIIAAKIGIHHTELFNP